ISNFFKQRAIFLLSEKQIEQDVIQSVLHDDIGVFTYTIEKAKLLSEKRNDSSFKFIEESLVRVTNLAKDKQKDEINTELFETKSEKVLYETFETIQKEFTSADTERNASEALAALTRLADPIHEFFENNMVMAEDKNIRHNRLALIQQIAELIYNFADL